MRHEERPSTDAQLNSRRVYGDQSNGGIACTDRKSECEAREMKCKGGKEDRSRQYTRAYDRRRETGRREREATRERERGRVSERDRLLTDTRTLALSWKEFGCRRTRVTPVGDAGVGVPGASSPPCLPSSLRSSITMIHLIFHCCFIRPRRSPAFVATIVSLCFQLSFVLQSHARPSDVDYVR